MNLPLTEFHVHIHYAALPDTAMTMPPPVRTNFVVFPPGCDDSVADFWGWGAHEAQLRCTSDVSGDMYMKMRYQDGPLSLNLLTTQTMVTMGDLPLPGKIPTVEPGIEPGTSWLVVRNPDH